MKIFIPQFNEQVFQPSTDFNDAVTACAEHARIFTDQGFRLEFEQEAMNLWRAEFHTVHRSHEYYITSFEVTIP